MCARVPGCAVMWLAFSGRCFDIPRHREKPLTCRRRPAFAVLFLAEVNSFRVSPDVFPGLLDLCNRLRYVDG
uniref:Putative secreted peptide n=1 Tax=Anopheles braziliensis TaxID=58242 RepID=A0A2M3ZXP1_9DIPT